MTQDHIRLCPTCGAENPPAALRCACGALLTGVDISRRAPPAFAATPAPEVPIFADADAAETGLVCPFEDCAQSNPAGSTLCLYCNRPLAAAPQPEVHASLISLPKALRERYRIQRALPAGGAEAELLIVEPLAGGEACVAKIYRHGIHPKAAVQERLKTIAPAHKVRLLETGLSDGFTYELMEYCPAGSLRNLLQDGPLAPPLLRELVAELAAALAAVHAVKLIHRDLKPENVLIRRRHPLDLVLTDFGISSIQEATLLFTGMARTLAYAAPETIAGILDKKTDYWSLGMIFLEAALGRHPFAGLSDAVILHRLTTRPMDLGAVRDPDFRKLLRGLLLRDPKARWGEAEVRRWLQGDPGLGEPVEEAGDLAARKPYRIGDEDCFTADQLAVGLARHWQLAAADLDNGLLMNWFRLELKDQNLVRLLIELNGERQASRDSRLLRLILHLAPGLPPVWRGESVALGAILAQAGQALKGSKEAGDWLVDLAENRVLDAYAGAGNPEMADLLGRWQDSLADFNRAWEAAEQTLRAPRPGAVAYFDDVVFGQNAGLKRPAAGLLLARLLAICFDAAWTARLRKLLKTEIARLLPDCPWLAALGNPADCPSPNLLVLHGFLQEARRRAVQAREQQADIRQAAAAKVVDLRGKAVLVVEGLRQASTPVFFSPDACLELEARLEAYFSLLAQVRGLGLADADSQKLRAQMNRWEPQASRIRRLLNELTERRTQNRGWFNLNTARVAGFGAFLLVMFGGQAWLPLLLVLAAGILTWRLLPNYWSGSQIRRLGAQIQG